MTYIRKLNMADQWIFSNLNPLDNFTHTQHETYQLHKILPQIQSNCSHIWFLFPWWYKLHHSYMGLVCKDLYLPQFHCDPTSLAELVFLHSYYTKHCGHSLSDKAGIQHASVSTQIVCLCNAKEDLRWTQGCSSPCRILNFVYKIPGRWTTDPRSGSLFSPVCWCQLCATDYHSGYSLCWVEPDYPLSWLWAEVPRQATIIRNSLCIHHHRCTRVGHWEWKFEIQNTGTHSDMVSISGILHRRRKSLPVWSMISMTVK